MKYYQKVVCIRSYSILISRLTNGKVYNVLDAGGDISYKIINDLCYFEWYFQNRFISLGEFRRKKLEKLGCVSNQEEI